MSDVAEAGANHTFRRFEPGETAADWDLEEKIFQADASYKCPTYIHKTPPCQGSCPSGHESLHKLMNLNGRSLTHHQVFSWEIGQS